jgi:uroporphyrinogen decarboxylase
MNHRERVLAALRCEEPDRVPYCEMTIGQSVLRDISGRNDPLSEKEISRILGRDNIRFDASPPFLASRSTGSGGTEYLVDGLIKTRDDLRLVQLPDPRDTELIRKADGFVAEKGDYAAIANIRLGISPVLNSMGIEAFSYALYEDRQLISDLLESYANWTIAVVDWLQEFDFDVLWAYDDVAFSTGPFMRVDDFRELFLPHLRRVAARIRIPWIFHSDGNILPLLEDLLTLGMSGLNPIEPGAMDIDSTKDDYGQRVCLVGNISVDTLARGTPQEVEEEVRHRILRLAPGGGYIASSANSIPDYAKPENVIAMVRAIEKYGRYPVS